jgi:hypothetical protein
VLVPEIVTEEVEESVVRDWVELESTLELDVDDSRPDVVDIETDDSWEVDEGLELDSVLELEDRTMVLDWVELESTLELDADDGGPDVVDVDTDDSWEVEVWLELDSLLELEDRTMVLDLDDEVVIFELEELALVVVEAPEGGAIA